MSTSPSISHPSPGAAAADDVTPDVPHEPLGRLFLRFLKFGSLAWGGPVAQIAMIRQELVTEEKWVTPQHFNRVLAMYQILPGPEAHELCVYFGYLSRGRVGLIAGTTIALMMVSIRNIPTVIVFALALAALFYFKSKITIPLVVAAAAVAGYGLSVFNV